MVWHLCIVCVTFVTFHNVIYGSNDLITESFMRLQPNNFHPIHDHVRLNFMDSLHSQSESFSLSTCQNYADKYAAKAAQFTTCSIEHASPFRLCENCVGSYMEAAAIYSDIDQMGDNQDSCKTILLGSSQIQIIKTFNETFQRIWSSSYCEKCFANISVTNEVVNYTASNDTLMLQQQYINITDCFNVSQQNGTDTCQACHHLYEPLLEKFERFYGNWKNVEICMDLVDMMNSTRVYWGGTLKCTEMHQIYFKEFVLAVILVLLPVVFYVGFGVYGTKKEQKQIMKQKRLIQHKRNYGSLEKNDYVSTQRDILPQPLTSRPQGSMSSVDSMDQNIIANRAMGSNVANWTSSKK